jgi:DNA polymerase-1
MTQIQNPPVVLVDGSSYLYRAFHALPPLNTSTGQPTGAVKGVISMIRRLMADYPNSPMAVVFDAKGKNFRHELYPEYKAHRPPMPDELRAQIEPIHNIIKAMGIPLLAIEGVEADDVIGTLAHQATNQGRAAIISTGDKDMAQLVNQHIKLVNTMKNEVLDVAGVTEKYGLPPERIVDYLALMGDSSDGIPGVPSCGPKTAQKWLAEFGSLEGVMTAAENMKGKTGEKLRESLHFLPMSQVLATIKTDVDIPVRVDDLQLPQPNIDALRELFKACEFKSWVSELQSMEFAQANLLPPAEKKTSNYAVILNDAEFNQWLEKLTNAEVFAIDTETTSLDYMEAQLVGVSFCVKSGEAAYVACAHDYLGAPKQLSRDFVLSKLKPLLEDRKKKKIGQHIKYDMSVFANYGVNLQGIAYDTMLESYVFNATGSRHDMDTLAEKYLQHQTTSFTDIAGKGAKQLTFNQIELDKAAPYAAEDADVTFRLHEVLWPALCETPTLKTLFEEIEMPLVPVLSNIERTGALIDVNLLGKQSQEIGKRLVELEKEVYALAGEEFNLSSPKQLQVIFYEKLKLPITKKTPTGQPSTDESVLEELALDYPLPKLILEYRGLSKLKSTYTDRLPEQVNARTGRVHTSYHQAVTATGRLSSSDPNLQNIPIRTPEGRRIRQAFIAPKGYKLVAADYSQIELRIMAHLSQDKGLLFAFEKNMDVHKATAAEVFGVVLEDVTREQRSSAKAINFGLMYGMSAFGLTKQLGITRHEAQHYIDCYFERYPGVHDYMDRTRKTAAQQGYVETLFGRRLYLPDINTRDVMRRKAAERTAINAPLQGTAADIIKRAMIAVDAWLQTEKIDARMIMQVHDELVFEVNENQIDKITSVIKEKMSQAAQLSVTLVVDVGVGDNWDEAH